MPGTMTGGGFFKPKPLPPPSPSAPAYAAAGQATKQQGMDYDNIMNRYRDIYDQIGGMGSGGTVNMNYDVTVPTYQTTQDYKSAIGNLGGLAANGGYSDEDIANIRERGISPIRSVYKNAQQGLDRQRSLQGGYSPNYTAVSAKMAREMSSQLSDATTNVNAQIAQSVAQNRLAASTPYANITAGEQQSRNDFAQRNAEMLNRLGLDKLQYQTQMMQFPIQSKLSALSGMTNLYGTTPAFANMMNTGALNNATLNNNIYQSNKNRGLNLIRSFGG